MLIKIRGCRVKYDPETELYYLQSRYYDPLTGRFINADDPDYTDTQSGSPLSTNMFAYCENNPVLGYDPTGNDAIWIQQKAAASYAGHVSALFQDDKGNWRYFYWGPSCVQLLKLKSNYKDDYFKKLLSSPKKLSNAVNAAIDDIKGYRDNNYNLFIYFKGRFVKSIRFVRTKLLPIYNKFKKAKSNKYYDTINRNCLHATCAALVKGTFNQK